MHKYEWFLLLILENYNNALTFILWLVRLILTRFIQHLNLNWCPAVVESHLTVRACKTRCNVTPSHLTTVAWKTGRKVLMWQMFHFCHISDVRQQNIWVHWLSKISSSLWPGYCGGCLKSFLGSSHRTHSLPLLRHKWEKKHMATPFSHSNWRIVMSPTRQHAGKVSVRKKTNLNVISFICK